MPHKLSKAQRAVLELAVERQTGERPEPMTTNEQVGAESRQPYQTFASLASRGLVEPVVRDGVYGWRVTHEGVAEYQRLFGREPEATEVLPASAEASAPGFHAHALEPADDAATP